LKVRNLVEGQNDVVKVMENLFLEIEEEGVRWGWVGGDRGWSDR
jgi:hypothetical protein